MTGSALPTIATALAWAAERLARAGCESPRLDAEILLAERLHASRAHLLARDDDALPSDGWEQFRAWVARREKREPVAYIIGRREFYGLDFTVTPTVLIPRPETEHLVEEALALARSHSSSLRAEALSAVKGQRSNLSDAPRLLRRSAPRNDSKNEGAGVFIADVGTGSGAIAVALAIHLPRARVCALDASAEALAAAWRNADRHNVLDRVCLLQSDLLENLPQPADIIAANLPYVSDAEWDSLTPEIRLYEPAMALRGGPDGLDAIRRLLGQSSAHLRPGGAILLEIGAGQAAYVRDIALAVFPDAEIRVVQDYAGLDRVAVIQPHETTDELR